MTSSTQEKARPRTSGSVASSTTHVQNEKTETPETEYNTLARIVSPGQGESALPEDKKEEAIENLEDDWADDPINPRNWPARKKWTCVGVVRRYPLSPCMMNH